MRFLSGASASSMLVTDCSICLELIDIVSQLVHVHVLCDPGWGLIVVVVVTIIIAIIMQQSVGCHSTAKVATRAWHMVN